MLLERRQTHIISCLVGDNGIVGMRMLRQPVYAIRFRCSPVTMVSQRLWSAGAQKVPIYVDRNPAMPGDITYFSTRKSGLYWF